jgi:Flp pilus assembly protein TadG
MAITCFKHRTKVRVRHSREAGQALVEAALMMPILALILIGVAEIAHAAYVAIQVSNAAKAGVQYGAQNGATAEDTVGISNAAANDAANLDSSQLLTTSSYSCACSDGTTAPDCGSTICPNSHPEEIVTVNTTYTVHPLFNYPGLSTSFTLHGQAIQKCSE